MRFELVLLAVAACSSSNKSPSSAGEADVFMTRVYAPPANPVVKCPAGVPDKLVPEWHSMKADDRVSPADVYVHLDAAQQCTVGIGQFPRLCKNTDGWTTTCTNRDGSRPHVGQIRCTPTTLEIWVVAPEGQHRIVELPRPGTATCGPAVSAPR